MRALALAAATRDLAVCGVVRREVGRALRPPGVRRKFGSFWEVMINTPSDHRRWEQVEQTLWELGRQGITVPLSDAIIACSARRIGAVVLADDHHISLIPSVRVVDHLEE